MCPLLHYKEQQFLLCTSANIDTQRRAGEAACQERLEACQDSLWNAQLRTDLLSPQTEVILSFSSHPFTHRMSQLAFSPLHISKVPPSFQVSPVRYMGGHAPILVSKAPSWNPRALQGTPLQIAALEGAESCLPCTLGRARVGTRCMPACMAHPSKTPGLRFSRCSLALSASDFN